MRSCSFEVENGKFKEVHGDRCSLISDVHAKLDDWDCVIADEDLICTCSQVMDNSQIKLKYIIRKNGTSLLALYRPPNKRKIVQKRCLATHNKFALSGIVTLTCGNILKRFARFEHTKEMKR
jgi:hypothetical protein